MSDKNEILEAIKSLEKTMDKRLSKLEDDMRKVLKCVNHENADFDLQDHHPKKIKARA